MKTLLTLLLLFVAGTGFAFCQTDTVLNFTNVGTQVDQVVQAAAGHDLTWKIMLFAAIAGVLTRIIYSTLKGIKNPRNGSPMQFIFSYWVKDNVLPKITTVLTFVLSSSIFANLPAGTWYYIMFGVMGFIAGLFIDWVTDILKAISPKTNK